MNDKIRNNFRLPNELLDISIKALQAGHKIKLCSLLSPMPTQEELAEEADLWEVAAEIET
jgi:hypothetical protein